MRKAEELHPTGGTALLFRVSAHRGFQLILRRGHNKARSGLSGRALFGGQGIGLIELEGYSHAPISPEPQGGKVPQRVILLVQEIVAPHPELDVLLNLVANGSAQE